MLGKDLVPALKPDHEVLPLDRSACDVTVGAEVSRVFRDWQPELVVHCAAYTDVDGCEQDSERAFAVNAQGAANVVRAAAQVGARVFYISTDYVFDGTKKSPYNEQDPTNPVNIYGRSKLEGEQRTLEQDRENQRHLSIRTSWLYGIHGANFIEKIVAAAGSRPKLAVVADQVGCPTWTVHLARKIAELARTSATGILNVAGSGQCSWHEFARSIVEKLSFPVEVAPIDSVTAGRAAKRPSNSVLGSQRLEQMGLTPLPHWKQALEEYFQLRQTMPVAAQKQKNL